LKGLQFYPPPHQSSFFIALCKQQICSPLIFSLVLWGCSVSLPFRYLYLIFAAAAICRLPFCIIIEEIRQRVPVTLRFVVVASYFFCTACVFTASFVLFLLLLLLFFLLFFACSPLFPFFFLFVKFWFAFIFIFHCAFCFYARSRTHARTHRTYTHTHTLRLVFHNSQGRKLKNFGFYLIF